MIPVTITIDDTELRKFMTSFESNLPEFCSQTIRGLATRYRNRLAKETKLRGHYASGYLVRSMKVMRLGPKSYAVTAARYMNALESGTRPHFIPETTKAWTWAMMHGMSFQDMKKIIAKRGTRPHPFSFEVLYDFYWNELDMELSWRTERFLRSGARYT